MGATYAVLIGIETYQKQGISSVQFAQADAAAMKDVLVQDLGVPAENITLWLDSEATKSVFENDLPYLIRQTVFRRSLHLLLCRSRLLRQRNAIV